jgi:hypothetical protein
VINDVTYELIRIVKKINLDNTLFERIEENISKVVNKDIENIIKEMVETDSQFRFKKSIFDRQYKMSVDYSKCGEVVIKPKEGLGLVTIMDIDEFLEILSFRIYKGIEKAKEEHENWKLWKMSKIDLENMGVM